MCGITGELRLDGGIADLTCIHRMMEGLEMRGPDHAGSYSDGPLGLGHRRLSIIDLSSESNQPMIDRELGLVIVFNGSIYNYPELREQLREKGHRFVSSGDTEVILKAVAEWGDEAPRYLDGMFAFAVWNMRAKTLLLARDRMGIKPLYYALTPRGLVFGSNTQSILQAPEVDVSFDPLALHNLLTLHGVVPAPRTVLNGIKKLPPAHTLSIDLSGQQNMKQYWRLSAKRETEPCGDEQWLERIDAALQQAVKKRNHIADVPVGVLLSGGLDSSLLVGLLAKIGIDKIQTFSIGFDDQPEEKGSEFEYSDAVVDYFATDHQKIHIPNEQALTRLPEAIQHMSEPMFGQDAIGFYLLAEQVRQYVKVIQSGQGADEVFAGYFWYQQTQQYTHSDVLKRFAPHYFDRDHEEMAEIFCPPYQSHDYTGELVRELLESPDADEHIDAVLRADVTTFIVDDPVKRVDNMTMAWGLEARVPFLDHQLVELAARMPPHLKLSDGGKYALKRIARGLIPDAVIDRPKAYFPVPALKFVRGEFLTFMMDLLTSQTARQRGLIQSSYIDRLLDQPEAHLTRIKGSKLWQLALLELWLQQRQL